MILRRQLIIWLHWLYSRAEAALSAAPAGTLPLTGVLGFAAVLFTLRHLRGSGDQRRAAADPSPAGGSVQSSGQAARVQASQKGTTAASPPASRLSAKLAGVKLVTVSAPGVLFQEATAEQIEEGASVCPEAVEALREVCAAVPVCIIAHVLSDVGEAVVKGSLEAQGLLGPGQSQLMPHRVLCCSTPQGKESIVRQLEPGLHIDADLSTVTHMQRFVPRLVHIGPMSDPSSRPPGNVSHVASLTELFGGV